MTTIVGLYALAMGLFVGFIAGDAFRLRATRAIYNMQRLRDEHLNEIGKAERRNLMLRDQADHYRKCVTNAIAFVEMARQELKILP